MMGPHFQLNKFNSNLINKHAVFRMDLNNFSINKEWIILMKNFICDTEGLVFICKEHKHPATVCCIETGCIQRILCSDCINTSHQRHNVRNIADLFRLAHWDEISRPFPHSQIKQATEALIDVLEKLRKKSLELEAIISTNNNDEPAPAVEVIRSAFNEIKEKIGLDKAIVDSPELEEAIQMYLLLSSKKHVSNETKHQEMNLRKEVREFFVDISQKFRELSRIFTHISPIQFGGDLKIGSEEIAESQINGEVLRNNEKEIETAEEKRSVIDKSEKTEGNRDLEEFNLDSSSSSSSERSKRQMEIENIHNLSQQKGRPHQQESEILNENRSKDSQQLNQQPDTHFNSAGTNASQLVTVLEEVERYFQRIKEGTSTIADLEDFIDAKQYKLASQCKNWLESSDIQSLITLMDKTYLSSESLKLARRAEEHKTIISKYDFLSNIKFNEFGNDLLRIWQLEISHSNLEELLEKFFECKKAIYYIKSFLHRTKLLELDFIKFFIQGNDETENQRILEGLEEISISNAVVVKEKALSYCRVGFDLGAEFAMLIDAIDTAEKVRAGVIEILNNDPKEIQYSIVQLEIIKCMQLNLFFDELTAFKDFYIVSKVHWEEKLLASKKPAARIAFEWQPSVEFQRQASFERIMEPFKNLQRPLLLPPPELNKEFLPLPLFEWAAEAANFMGNLSKSEKLLEAVAKFSNTEESLSEICFKFRLLTPRVIENYDGQYTGALQRILTKGLKLQPCTSEHINQLIKCLQAIRWNASAQTTLIRSNVTYEEIEECFTDLKTRGLNKQDYPVARKLEDKLREFQAVEEEILALDQGLDWRRVIDKSAYNEIIDKFYELKQKCRQLGVDKYSTSALIDENIAVLEEAAKIASPLKINTKYNFELLEKLFDKLSEVFGSGDETHFFYLKFSGVYSQARFYAAEKEALKGIRISNLVAILSDILEERMPKHQLPEKIEEIKEYARHLESRIEKLQQSLLEIPQSFFEQIVLDAQSIGHIHEDFFLRPLKKAEIQEFLLKLEDTTLNKYELLINWTLITHIILRRKTNPFSLWKKAKELLPKVPSEYSSVFSRTRMCRSLFQIVSRGESLIREVKYIRTVFKLRKALAESKEKTKIIPYIDADYLKGIGKRLAASRISFTETRKILASAIEFSYEEKETFRKMLGLHETGGKIPDSEFKKFAKKAYTSVVINKQLDIMVRGLIAQRKEWEEKAKMIKTKNMAPATLLTELQEFSLLYDKYPIQSQSCEKLVKALAAFTPLYEEYNELDNADRESVTQDQIAEFEKKLKNFINEFGAKINSFALVKFKRLVWTLKTEIISSTFLGLLAGNKIKAEEVRRLVNEAKKLAIIEGTSSSGHLEDFLNELAERIRIAILDIERVESLQELEAVSQRFDDNVDLGLIYRNKVSELKYKISKMKLKEEETRDKEMRLLAAKEGNPEVPYQKVSIMTADADLLNNELQSQLRSESQVVKQEEEILSISSEFFRVSEFESSRSRASEPQMNEAGGYILRSRSRSLRSDDDDDVSSESEESVASKKKRRPNSKKSKGKSKKSRESAKVKQEEGNDDDLSFNSKDIVAFHSKSTKSGRMAAEPPIKKKIKKNGGDESEVVSKASRKQTRSRKIKTEKASSERNYSKGEDADEEEYF